MTIRQEVRRFVLTSLAVISLIVTSTIYLGSQSIPNHKPVVEAARAKYDKLTSYKRAYCIVTQVTWDLRMEGAGSFYKTSGTQYNERSIDVIIYKPNKETFDILGDAEGSANPQWSRTTPTGFGDIKLWRTPVDPSTVGCGTATEPPIPVGDDRKKLIEIRDNINEYLGDQ